VVLELSLLEFVALVPKLVSKLPDLGAPVTLRNKRSREQLSGLQRVDWPGRRRGTKGWGKPEILEPKLSVGYAEERLSFPAKLLDTYVSCSMLVAAVFYGEETRLAKMHTSPHLLRTRYVVTNVHSHGHH
jgi:hypothetical protein